VIAVWQSALRGGTAPATGLAEMLRIPVSPWSSSETFAGQARHLLGGRGHLLLLPPTVWHEFRTIFTDGASPADRELARAVLVNLRRWGIQPFDLDSTAKAIARRFTQNLLDRRLLPAEQFNDGLILAESSMAEIPLLVTSNKHLLDSNEGTVLLAPSEAYLPAVRPVHPKRLLRALR
jgi:hypothetical protein